MSKHSFHCTTSVTLKQEFQLKICKCIDFRNKRGLISFFMDIIQFYYVKNISIQATHQIIDINNLPCKYHKLN